MNQSKYINYQHDCYNQGPLVETLEFRIAELLGKEKALFFHKGITAQLTALKVIAEEKNNNKVVLHPQSHIAGDEKNAYQELMNLHGIEIGVQDTPFTAKQVAEVDELVGSLTIEIPLRRAGFKLTPWNELKKMQEWSYRNKTHFHMDGARLWESTQYYQKSLAEISNLFDSVYVSLYKGLGGLSGAVLTGDSEFIDSCKVWRSRLGGDLYSAFPMLITALEGIDNHLEQIPSWVERAHEIASILNHLDKIHVDKPHTNGFLVFIEADLEELNKKSIELNRKHGFSLFPRFVKSKIEQIQKAEFQVGIGAEEISNEEILDYFHALLSSTAT
jgi:threonine aldolase